ncbi:MAG: hypothetical protein WCS96_02835 [Victivallales bacterium]
MKKAMLMLAAAVIFGLGTVVAAQDDGNAGDGKKKAAKAARVAAKDNADAAKDKVKDARNTAKDKHDAVVDKRQDNQSKRIQHGINKGYLTPDEAKGLQDQQQKIAAMESTFKSDGKLTKDECSKLKDALNAASANIWAEKHDTDGKQMPVYRLGKNVIAKNSLTSQLSNQNMTGAEAKALTGDFRKMLDMKRSLATDDLPADVRAKKQADYDALLNKYYEVR